MQLWIIITQVVISIHIITLLLICVKYILVTRENIIYWLVRDIHLRYLKRFYLLS